MTDISLDALKLRERELEIDAVLIRGRVLEVRAMIEELQRRRGGRPRKGEKPDLGIIPGRVAGGIADTEVEDNMRAIDEVRGILKEDVG